MIIGIDANEANLTPQRVGVNQYAFELLKAIYALKTNHTFVIYLKTAPLADLPKARSGWEYRVIPFPKLWTQTRLPWDLFTRNPRPEVFLSLTHYAPRIAPMPTVVAIMDLGFLQTPEQFTAKDFNQLKSWTRYSVKNARKVIAISEHTRKDIMREYGKSSADIVITPLAYEQKLFKPTTDVKVLDKYGITQPYILFLGSLRPSKNIEGLVKAFAKLSLKDLPLGTQLVIAGKKAWLFEQIFNEVKQLNLTGKVVFTGFVEEAEKPVLMSMAQALVLPSFYEGFGIPVLEAMACGTPVVVSDVASLPEVAGEAGIYVNPRSPDSIAAGIMKAVGPERDQWIKKGLARVKLFNWAKTARATLKAVEACTAKT
ncbi:MAG: glycosyltransferase family 1 protein [bacterium]|nr:glycosyltransferase family 1 protein [bacterium]